MNEESAETFKVPFIGNKVNKPISSKEAISVAPANVIGNKEKHCPYLEPKWSAIPDDSLVYKLEVLKSGSIIEEVENLQEKSFWIFGRLPECDIVMAHPTISRYHCILQYRPKSADENVQDESKFGQGWYIYDMGSTHGTFLNKMRVPPKTYIQVKVGHIVKLGASTRNFILQGPECDEEPQSELTVTELKELRHKELENRRKEIAIQAALREKEGINWGMGEDADEETDLTVNPYASTNNEDLYLEDPKKTLRGFFEREGLDLEYKADEMSPGTFVCRIELPIDDANGRPLIAEVCHKGKKKDCVLQCALEACKILDRHGVLRQSHHEPLKRKSRTVDSDDDDDFLDRTGDIQRKKLRKAAATQNNVLTYEDLLHQEKELLESMNIIESNIEKYQEQSKRTKEISKGEDDDLDTFMANLSKDSTFDKTEIRKLRVEQQRLKNELQKIQNLIKIAKPVELPSLNKPSSLNDNKKKLLLPLFGKRNKMKFMIPRTETQKKDVEKKLESDEEEIDDEVTETQKFADQKIITTEKPAEPSKLKESKTNLESTEVKMMPDDSKTSEPKRILGPAFIPPEIRQHSLEDDSHEKLESETVKDIEKEAEVEDETSSGSKKRRSRIRMRTKGRENVDIDDATEQDIEKYSGWIPPDNQRGDGYTELNDKFGY